MSFKNNFPAVFTQKENTSAWTAFFFVPCVALALYVFAFRLWQPYSYWLDELSSVSASNQSFHRLLALLLADVHPPLYQFVLKTWIGIWGDGEVACRMLSALSAGLTAVILWAFVRRHFTSLPRWVAMLILVTNTLFLYYANEARPYAMTCMMATLAVTLFLDRPQKSVTWSFLLALIALSLCHYFGLILAGLMVLICLWEVRRDPGMLARVFLTGAMCLVWPMVHAFQGSLLSVTGGNFWIEVRGVRDTLSIASSGFMPRASALGPAVIVLLGLVALIASTTRCAGTPSANQPFVAPLYLTLRRLGALLLMLLTTVALIDLWSPISTNRNYIVALPLVALLAASCASWLLQWTSAAHWPITGIVTLYALASLQIAHGYLIKKSAPHQDWKSAAQAAVALNPQATFYITNPTEEYVWRPLSAAHYVSKFAKRPVTMQSYVPGVTVLQRPAIILSGHDQGSPESMWEDLQAQGAQAIFQKDDGNRRGYAPAAWYVPAKPASP